MPRGRPKKDAAEKAAEKRLTIRFSGLDERHMMVFDYLKELPYGQKTDAIVNAICYRATEYHSMMTDSQVKMENIQKYIHEEIQRAIPQIAETVVKEMQKSGLVLTGDAVQNTPERTSQDEHKDSDGEDQDMTSAFEALRLAAMFSG